MSVVFSYPHTNNNEITIDEFLSVPMTVNNFIIDFMGKFLKDANNLIKAQKVETDWIG